MNKVLIAFFSRKGENFNVGTVEKGSAEIIASFIAEQLHAEMYRIQKTEDYPESLEECNRIAKEEHQTNARPALRNPVPDTALFDRVVLVFPNWWNDLPMAVYSFLDAIKTEGLAIYPVCTHEDNGLAMTERMLQQAYPKAEIRKGIAIRGSIVQKDWEQAKEKIEKYLIDSKLV